MTSSNETSTAVIVVGTGFAGLGMAIRLEQAGRGDYVVLERADDVGGTWRDNTYPGCACDVPSNLYSFSFALNPDWSRAFSPQPEIWDYLRRCARDHGVLPKVRFGREVIEARWDEDDRRWVVTAATGETFRAPVLVLGTGALSEPSTPDIAGVERFAGTAFHTARWDHDHDLSGERVAVIGTGASAVQVVPAIQPIVGHLDVYQRTPAWVMSRRDRALSGLEHRLFRRVPALQRLVREAIYWGRETFVLGFSKRPRLMERVERAAAAHLARQVPDPALRTRLTPDFRIGCKRILLSDDWYPALTRPNVDVVTEGIAEIRERSVVTTDGTERPVDTIVWATGFHVTDMPMADRIVGRQGTVLADRWEKGMEAYLGTTIAGFPNLFMLVGPNTGLGHSSMVYMIESQVAYVMDALRTMDERRLATVEVRPEVSSLFNQEIQSQLGDAIWSVGGCRSWYLDENGRNTTLWPTFTFTFRRRTRRFDLGSYRQEARTS